MKQDISFLIVTPHALRKGQTGAILSRLLSRTNLSLAAAQVLAPDAAFAGQFAEALAPFHACPCQPAYIREKFAPAADGRARTMLALLMRGENAVEQVKNVAGSLKLSEGAGVTIRDSFAEIGRDADGRVVYFEPAVIVPESAEEAAALLPLLADLARRSANIVENSAFADGSGERTLVIIKPENWRRPGIRPGAILDIFTRTGLMLVGCKIQHNSVAQALEFYGPVQDALRSKLAPKIAGKAKDFLEKQFSVSLRTESADLLTQSVGRDFADDQFYQIVEFMSGVNPVTCSESDRALPGKAQCMILIFEGRDAIAKVRTVLGPTDPSKAPGGTVRGEFGTDVMVNAGHASDAPESFVRETRIVRITDNEFAALAADC